MQQSPSIVRYEQLYLASFVLGLIATVLSWNDTAAILTANPMLFDKAWILPVATAIGAAITLLLWYFTARRPSIVAKWIVVIFAGFSALAIVSNLFAIATGRSPSIAAALLALMVSGLSIAAALLLFKPDAKAWFGEDLIEEGEPIA